MARKILLALLVPLVGVALFLVRGHVTRQRPAEKAAINSQLQQHLANVDDSSAVGSHVNPVVKEPLGQQLTAAPEADPPGDRAQRLSSWKRYDSSEYGFEISYPPDWLLVDSYENNYGKPPSGHGSPAYAGETRTLFGLERDGPDQSHDGGGDFSDGAMIDVQITGTTGNVEDWSGPDPWTLRSSTPADWMKLNSSLLGDGGGARTLAIDTNGFKGAVHVVCTGSNPCELLAEEGGAYRMLPSGRVLLIGWKRFLGRNDFSYQKYLLPMLASFRPLN